MRLLHAVEAVVRLLARLDERLLVCGLLKVGGDLAITEGERWGTGADTVACHELAQLWTLILTSPHIYGIVCPLLAAVEHCFTVVVVRE